MSDFGEGTSLNSANRSGVWGLCRDMFLGPKAQIFGSKGRRSSYKSTFSSSYKQNKQIGKRRCFYGHYSNEGNSDLGPLASADFSRK